MAGQLGAPAAAPAAAAGKFPGEDPQGAGYVGRREVARRQAARAAGAAKPAPAKTPSFSGPTGYSSQNTTVKQPAVAEGALGRTIGTVAGGLAGGALGSVVPGFGTLAGAAAGAYAGYKLGDEGFKDPDAEYKKAQKRKQTQQPPVAEAEDNTAFRQGYEQGIRYYRRGPQNPYKPGTPEFTDYNDGYHNGEADSHDKYDTSGMKESSSIKHKVDKIGNMPSDKFDTAISRLKHLAGAGPLKTVWDPVKRVYKNVPVASMPANESRAAKMAVARQILGQSESNV
jgi:uncharacterized protein YcfJ